MTRFQGTATYVAGDELKTAVNAAIALERPLLVKGEPGTGKTLLAQEIVGEFDVRLVDLVDQQHRPLGRRERLPQLAAADVVGDLGDARVAELRISQPRDGVVFVEPLLGASG